MLTDTTKKKINGRPVWMEWIPIPNKRCHFKNTNAVIEYLQKGFVLRSEWEKLWINKYQHMYIIEE